MRPASTPTILICAPVPRRYLVVRAPELLVSNSSNKLSPKTIRLHRHTRVSQLFTHTLRRPSRTRIVVDDQLEKMRAAAEKAIELDPLLAEGHAALGMAYARDGNWEQSEKSFRSAIELDPNRSDSHSDFAMYLLLVLGRTKEALAQLRLAESTDPRSPEIQHSP